MNMPFCKLQAPLPVEFLEKGSSSSNPMIVSQGFEASFKRVRRDLKLEILNDGICRQSTRFVVFGDVEDYLTFMTL
jgi:hypothetical protein